MAARTRCLGVDDHPVVRQGLALLFKGNEDIELVGTVTTGEEALEAIEKLQPEVVVMDEGHYFNDPERGYVWEQSIIGLDPRYSSDTLHAAVVCVALCLRGGSLPLAPSCEQGHLTAPQGEAHSASRDDVHR